MVALIPSLHGWAAVFAVIGLVAAMAYILLGYWRGRR
jgi:O-antigen/teichoic acid export membrane protein